MVERGSQLLGAGVELVAHRVLCAYRVLCDDRAVTLVRRWRPA